MLNMILNEAVDGIKDIQFYVMNNHRVDRNYTKI